MGRISPFLAFGRGGCSAPASIAGTAYVTSITTPGTVRNDGASYFTGFITNATGSGYAITALGRYKYSGDAATHSMALFNGSGVAIAGTTVSIDMTLAAAADGFVYVALGTPYVVAVSEIVRVACQETTGVDHFRDSDCVVVEGGAPDIDGGYYTDGISIFGNSAGSGHTYGPVNFLYT